MLQMRLYIKLINAWAGLRLDVEPGSVGLLDVGVVAPVVEVGPVLPVVPALHMDSVHAHIGPAAPLLLVTVPVPGGLMHQ